MDSSRKSFKALSQAQPIKKDIDQTLNKLQSEKRKFLALQREQTNLKEQLQKVKKDLNQAKLIQPKTRLYSNKNIQKQLSIHNADRSYQSSINRISNYRNQIDLERRQILKYKKLIKTIENDINKLISQNQNMEHKIIKKHEEIQTIKDNLYQYRTQNMKNTNQFKNSFQALHRSRVKQENQRKKSGAIKKSFLGQQMKNSLALNLNDYHQEEGTGQKKQDYMIDSVPLVRDRVKTIIHSNKEKVRISDNYRKFGEDLQNMFRIMKEYKGRDDIDFIAEEFVIKQKQVKKIQQYIGKLQNRMQNYQKQLSQIKDFDKMIQQDVNRQKQHPSQQNCIQMQSVIKQAIAGYINQEKQTTLWLTKIGQILKPILGEDLNRINAASLIGDLEDKLSVNLQTNNKKLSTKSNAQNSHLIEIDVKGFHNELLSYQKMKEMAQQYINNRKN